jgi:hypothetical protein
MFPFKSTKRHSWAWYAFWALLFCLFVYRIARIFLKTAEKNGRHSPRPGSWPQRNGKNKSRVSDALFV